MGPSSLHSGKFESFAYGDVVYYRLNYIKGFSWYRCNHNTNNLDNLSGDYSLISKLEEDYSRFICSIKNNNKLELKTKEVFNFVVNAIKNRTNYDSSKHQPNSSNILIVDSIPGCSTLYFADKHTAIKNLAAKFYVDNCTIFPPEDNICINFKKIYGLIFSFLSEEYGIQHYYYTDRNTIKYDKKYRPLIWRYKIEPFHKNEKLVKIFDEPITIFFHHNRDNFRPITEVLRTKLKLSTKTPNQIKSLQ